MPDLTDSELRELDLWVAEVAGIATETTTGDKWLFDLDGELFLHLDDDCQQYENGRDYLSAPWHPHASFDQAWEYLAPVLRRADLWTRAALVGPLADTWAVIIQNGENDFRRVRNHQTLALAFCLAAKAALENDD